MVTFQMTVEACPFVLAVCQCSLSMDPSTPIPLASQLMTLSHPMCSILMRSHQLTTTLRAIRSEYEWLLETKQLLHMTSMYDLRDPFGGCLHYSIEKKKKTEIENVSKIQLAIENIVIYRICTYLPK